MYYKNVLYSLSLMISFIGGYIVPYKGGVYFYHTIYLIPIAIILSTFLDKSFNKYQVRNIVLILVSIFAIFLSMVFEQELYSISVILLCCTIIMVCHLMGNCFSTSLKYILYKKSIGRIQKILLYAIVILILFFMFWVITSFFGNPITAILHKYYLDRWINNNLDETIYSVVKFKYSWYNSNFYYIIYDSKNNTYEKLVYWKKSNLIYSSWDNIT